MGVRREIGDMNVLPGVLVDIIAAYTQDDAKLKRMHDNLMERLGQCDNDIADMIMAIINSCKTGVITVAVCIDYDDSDVDYWIVNTHCVAPMNNISTAWRKLHPHEVFDKERCHRAYLIKLKNAGGIEDDEGRVWIQGYE